MGIKLFRILMQPTKVVLVIFRQNETYVWNVRIALFSGALLEIDNVVFSCSVGRMVGRLMCGNNKQTVKTEGLMHEWISSGYSRAHTNIKWPANLNTIQVNVDEINTNTHTRTLTYIYMAQVRRKPQIDTWRTHDV